MVPLHSPQRNIEIVMVIDWYGIVSPKTIQWASPLYGLAHFSLNHSASRDVIVHHYGAIILRLLSPSSLFFIPPSEF